MRDGGERPDDRLDSWKRIASHLKRDVSTVQRWEKREGMPVHRHLHDKLSSVFAYRSELDAWWQSRGSQLRGDVADVASPPVGTAPEEEPPRHRSRRMALAAGALGVLLMVSYGIWRLHDIPSRSRLSLADTRVGLLTDFEGIERAAAISRDGRWVAFASDRDGPMDIWVTQPGTGSFRNLTQGAVAGLANPDIRTLGFTPDASRVTLWVRKPAESGAATIGILAAPTGGGPIQPLLDGAAELDWSRDGGRLVYHTTATGDPMFVQERGAVTARRIYVGEPGMHCHYPVWSPDGDHIYFAQGQVMDQMDIWRIAPDGGAPERMTFHHSRVSYPTFVDAQTLLYLATAADGSGPWLYGLNVERRESYRISFGTERYTSLSASADGRRLVVTVANPRMTLWRVRVGSVPAGDSDAQRIEPPTTRARSPRFGAGRVIYVAAQGGNEGIWAQDGTTATRIWSARGARVIGGPAIAPDGRQIALAAEEGGHTHLYVMNLDGTRVRKLTDTLDLRGAPAWSADGKSLIFAAVHGDGPRVFSVAATGGTPAALSEDYSSDPVSSPDGRYVVYSGADVGTTFPVRALSTDGKPRALPHLVLSRGARRMAFLPGTNALVLLRGDLDNKNLWLVDLDTGQQRPLTQFERGFNIRDFDVSADGREIVFDSVQEDSDIALIERPPD